MKKAPAMAGRGPVKPIFLKAAGRDVVHIVGE